MKLFPSTLVINPSDSDLQKILDSIGHKVINNPDLFAVTEYKIEIIRAITKFLANKPIAHPSKIVLIQNVDHLQSESQNALLKKLEEPGVNNFFILTTNHPNLLLPTIISRCHQISYLPLHHTSTQLLIPGSDLTARLQQSELLATGREETISYLEEQLQAYHLLFISKPTTDNKLFIKKIIKTISLIKANVDPKTALDFLLLS